MAVLLQTCENVTLIKYRNNIFFFQQTPLVGMA